MVSNPGYRVNGDKLGKEEAAGWRDSVQDVLDGPRILHSHFAWRGFESGIFDKMVKQHVSKPRIDPSNDSLMRDEPVKAVGGAERIGEFEHAVGGRAAHFA